MVNLVLAYGLGIKPVMLATNKKSRAGKMLSHCENIHVKMARRRVFLL